MDDTNQTATAGNSNDHLVTMTANIVAAFVGSSVNRVDPGDIASIIGNVHSTLANLGQTVATTATSPEYVPAVSVKKSLASKDYIISLIDGKPYKTLRRHLGMHGLTPEQYRERFNLKADYPMVSENYSQVRRDMAKKIGLGTKRRSTDTTAAAKPAAAKKASKPAAKKAPAKKAATA